MDSLFVEEVAASLVREFLSRKGLKKTCVIMDQERPRSDLSINSRNDLRKVLHLEFLYKENKAKENPLKTNLELITRYFLDHFGNAAKEFTPEAPIPVLSVPKKSNRPPGRCAETTLVNIYDLSDEDAGWRVPLAETSKVRHDNLDGDVLGNFVSSKRPPHKSKPLQTIPGEGPALAPAWDKMENLKSSEPSVDLKRMGEKTRHKSGLIVRGLMAGPTASSPQDSFRKRSLRRSPALGSTIQPQEEDGRKVLELSACPAPQESSHTSALSRSPLGQLCELTIDKQKPTPSSPPHMPSKGLPPRERGRVRDIFEASSPVDGGPVVDRTPLKLYLPGGNSRTTQERLERAFKRQGTQPMPLRKNQMPVSDKADDDLGVLQLEDVEDDVTREDVILAPPMLKLQVASKPLDLPVAKEIKTLLFGSSTGCFNNEWKRQNFSFNDTASLKYGIVQNKGGPCGVLAAVQACVLKRLLFEGDGRADPARQLQPSNSHRTHCLALAIADILWQARAEEGVVVTLASGTQQFSPTGKYKADGVLETLTLHSLTCFEELAVFLQQNIQQFEAGPYGCILLALSAILSRSTELVRQDFDVPTNHLIGAHGYCTQELVNLLLTGRAVSNVFNDVVQLDSGDGHVTLLKGIAARSDVGFLSLFEHYSVCQVGCFLKTPKFPIWVVCSESHFSVLFGLQPELLRDWRAERLFDLYYYDGLANQQEQIRLTIDTTQMAPEGRKDDLVPPLELCIRTKWTGASVSWNGSEPIL
ncbi:probable ubiquitin carboxyl-terminal hydrolase MINDY-4 [Echinops telfairi]|uniref:Ubiquitin carboxyl-terminal hydrolase MINDY n=1 Tax=Echinops telfairi TaxID=9371 RepID=A0ABM0ZQE8_ECHTE|nr:probable ubiquitin carboxyl-terminal hydrolase MINDY-4 [Echinops telfairi]